MSEHVPPQMNMAPQQAFAGRCLQHPDREALGICVVCRRFYCSECITKIDGINHCKSCLGALQSTVESERVPVRAEQEQEAPARALKWQRRGSYLMGFVLLIVMLSFFLILSLSPALISKLSES